MRKKLEFQADRIEAVLTLHKVTARVTGGTVTPRWVRFQVLPPRGMGDKIYEIKGLAEELKVVLDVPNCRVSQRGATVIVEVGRDDPQPVLLVPLYRQLTDAGNSIPPMTAVLGLDEDGAPLLIRLPSPDVGNILIVGMAGAGKTNLLRSISLSLQWANPSASLCNVHIVDDLEVYDQIRQAGVIKLARRAGEYVVIATADINLAQCVGDVFPVRIVGRVGSAEDAYRAAGCTGARAEQLMGRGDFLVVAEGRVIRFQSAFVSPSELGKLTAQGGRLLEMCQSGLAMPQLSWQ